MVSAAAIASADLGAPVIYVAITVGQYYHEILGVYSTEEAAVSAAESYENDHHGIEVIPYELGKTSDVAMTDSVHSMGSGITGPAPVFSRGMYQCRPIYK